MNGFPNFCDVIPSNPLGEYEGFLERSTQEISSLFFKNDHHILSQEELDELITSGEITKKAFVSFYDSNKNKKFDQGEKLRYKSIFFFSTDGAILKRASDSACPDDFEILIFIEDNVGDVVSSQKHYVKIGKKVKEELSKNNNYVSLNHQLKNAKIIDENDKEKIEDLIKDSVAELSSVDKVKNLLFQLANTGKNFALLAIKLAISSVNIALQGLEKVRIEQDYWNPDKAEGDKFKPLFIPLIEIDVDTNAISLNTPSGNISSDDLIDEAINKVFDKLDEFSKPIDALLTALQFSNIAISPIVSNALSVNLSAFSSEKLRAEISNQIKSFTDFIVDGAIFVNAVICGILNSLIDAVAGILQIISLVFEGIKFQLETLDSIDIWTEYLDNFTQAVLKINWFKVLNEFIKFQLEVSIKVIQFLIAPSFNLSISIAEIGYFIGFIIGFIIEIIIGVFITGGTATVASFIRKGISIVKKIVTKIYEIIKKAVGVIARSIRNKISQFIRFLKKGTDNFLRIIIDIKTAFLRWLDEVLNTGFVRKAALSRWANKFHYSFFNHLEGEIAKLSIKQPFGEFLYLIRKGNGGHLLNRNLKVVEIISSSPTGNRYRFLAELPDDIPFKAKIEIKYKNSEWLPKDTNSSIFPKNWDKKRIQEEVAYVFDLSRNDPSLIKTKAKFNSKGDLILGKIEGECTSGFKIILEVDDAQNIFNAYPNI